VRTAITHLTLTDFRSYTRAELALTGRPVFLVGSNGAGKTNLLEAISLFTPGRGLRNAAQQELGRREPGEPLGRPWAVAIVVEQDGDPVRLGTGTDQAGASRRTVRREGETVPPGRLADHLRQVWLTPAQDRLFLEGAGDRRRFFDRLVFAAEPGHAAHDLQPRADPLAEALELEVSQLFIQQAALLHQHIVRRADRRITASLGPHGDLDRIRRGRGRDGLLPS
jgi:DNA replication and repair protein RecF